MKRTFKKEEVVSYVLTLDSEQAELVKVAAEMMHAACDARARRMDPDSVVSTATRMSRAKMASVFAQYDRGPLLAFAELDSADQYDILRLMQAFQEAESTDERENIWIAIRGYILRRDRRGRSPAIDHDAESTHI